LHQELIKHRTEYQKMQANYDKDEDEKQKKSMQCSTAAANFKALDQRVKAVMDEGVEGKLKQLEVEMREREKRKGVLSQHRSEILEQINTYKNAEKDHESKRELVQVRQQLGHEAHIIGSLKPRFVLQRYIAFKRGQRELEKLNKEVGMRSIPLD